MSKTKIIAEEGKQEMFIEREFDAPRELVFKAYTDPEIYTQWVGPKGYEMDLKEFDTKSGGKWSFTHKDPNGNEFAFHGVFHEVLAPERIIQTFEFDGLPEAGHVMLETARFEQLPGGRCKVLAQSIFQTVEDRDGMIQSGMEDGMNQGFEKLDQLLETMKKSS